MSTAAPKTIVLDASAGVEIALWTNLGMILAGHLAAVDTIVVPEHFHLEGVAALRRMEVRRELTPEAARQAFEMLFTLRARRVDTLPLLREAWGLRHNVTVADALYVVVARRLGVPLITGDIRLAGAPQLGVEILGPPPPT